MSEVTATITRPVRIHLAMKECPVSRAIKNVLPLAGNENSHVYVETASEADLIIFGNVRVIEKDYSNSKTYAFMDDMTGRGVKHLPANVVDLGSTADFMVKTLVELIQKVGKELKPLEVPTTPTTEEAVPLRADALRILVIDDTPKHIASAKKGLAGHRLTTVTGYEDAMNILDKEKFDVVLSDLHLPMSSRTMGDAFKLGELVPYGLLLMVEAAHQGAKHVAVVTDLNHHADPFSAAFDHFSGVPVKIDGANVVMMHASMVDGAKDWATALEQLMHR